MRTPTIFRHELRDGKLQAAKDFIQEVTTHKAEEYKEMLKRYDLNTTRFWFYHDNGKDYMLYSHDMGPKGWERLAQWNQEGHPFDAWFTEQLGGLFTTDHTSPQPEFFDAIIVE